MGIAYLIMLIVYIALAKGIYTIITKFTTKVWIKRSLIAFFILFPTYDIIIGNALKFYYCQFTELEKINKTIERPEVVLLQNGQRFDKYEYAVSEARGYLEIIKAIQIFSGGNEYYTKMVKIGGKEVIQVQRKPYNEVWQWHEFRAKKYTQFMELENVTEVNSSLVKKPNYIIIEEPVIFPRFINKFISGYGVQIIDVKTNEVIAWSKRINHEKYNFITIDTGYFLRGESCGGTSSGRQLLERSIKKDSK